MGWPLKGSLRAKPEETVRIVLRICLRSSLGWRSNSNPVASYWAEAKLYGALRTEEFLMGREVSRQTPFLSGIFSSQKRTVCPKISKNR